MEKKVFNAVEVMEFGRILDARFTAKFTGSYKYRTSYCEDDGATGNNVCNAIDAAWAWLHTGFVNNFISRDTETHSLNLNW